ncbi:MAG: hypothetical protein ABEH88_10280 [Halobacteriales archaeon]
MPTITQSDRVGVVMGSGADGLGAGNFILSCITAFYDRLRETRDDFFEYPDYYTFQATTDPADYRMLDIYPDHKNVTVEPDAEHILRAINDRVITILLVPEGPSRSPEIDDITYRSADRRINQCYLYASDGQPDKGVFTIRLPRTPTEDWYQTTFDSMGATTEKERPPHLKTQSSNGQIHQEFQQITLEQALSHLPTEHN